MTSEAFGSALPLVSICIPVKNGASRLPKCLQSVRELNYPQDRLELIVADGRSTDDTVEVAKSFGARVLDNPGEIVASGRNVAFGAAKGEFIACTDDDCVLPRDWIRTALATFDHPQIGAVGGISLLPEDAPTWAQAVNAVFRMASHAGYSVQSDLLADGDADDLPGCNAFYRADAYRSIAPFDEKLVTAEDVELHLRLLQKGHRLKTSANLFVWHDKRPTPQGLFRQMRRFAEGRVQLGRKFPAKLRPLHRLMGWALPLGMVGAAIAFATLPLAAIGTFTGAVFLAVGGKALVDGEKVSVALFAPVALTVMVMGWSLGYLKEKFFPMKSTIGR